MYASIAVHSYHSENANHQMYASITAHRYRSEPSEEEPLTVAAPRLHVNCTQSQAAALSSGKNWKQKRRVSFWGKGPFIHTLVRFTHTHTSVLHSHTSALHLHTCVRRFMHTLLRTHSGVHCLRSTPLCIVDCPWIIPGCLRTQQSEKLAKTKNQQKQLSVAQLCQERLRFVHRRERKHMERTRNMYLSDEQPATCTGQGYCIQPTHCALCHRKERQPSKCTVLSMHRTGHSQLHPTSPALCHRKEPSICHRAIAQPTQHCATEQKGSVIRIS